MRILLDFDPDNPRDRQLLAMVLPLVGAPSIGTDDAPALPPMSPEILIGHDVLADIVSWWQVPAKRAQFATLLDPWLREQHAAIGAYAEACGGLAAACAAVWTDERIGRSPAALAELNADAAACSAAISRRWAELGLPISYPGANHGG